MRFLKYASWFVLVPLDILSGVLAILLAPFVVPFYSEETGHLPKGFRWMETFDNPIDGDGGHIRRWANIRYHLGALGVYAQRVGWLWRNKAYNFAYNVLGREAQSDFAWKGNPKTEGGSDPSRHGYLLMWNDSAWGLYVFKPWLKVGKVQFCLRVYCGWKLKQEVTDPNGLDRAMLAFHINPLRYYVVER